MTVNYQRTKPVPQDTRRDLWAKVLIYYQGLSGNAADALNIHDTEREILVKILRSIRTIYGH